MRRRPFPLRAHRLRTSLPTSKLVEQMTSGDSYYESNAGLRFPQCRFAAIPVSRIEFPKQPKTEIAEAGEPDRALSSKSARLAFVRFFLWSSCRTIRYSTDGPARRILRDTKKRMGPMSAGMLSDAKSNRLGLQFARHGSGWEVLASRHSNEFATGRQRDPSPVRIRN